MMYLFLKRQRYLSNFALVILLSVYSFSCENKADNVDSSTRIFANYMKQIHGIDLPEDLTYFIVIPENTGCEGCKKMSFRYFENHKLPSNCKIIAGKRIEAQIASEFDYQYYIDTTNKIERLKLNTQTTALIKVQHKKIISNIEINPDNLDSVLSSLK